MVLVIMLTNKLKKFDLIKVDSMRKCAKYYLEIGENKKLVFNNGRRLEFTLQNNYGYKSFELENIPHTKDGDIKINSIPYNVKSYKCQLIAKGTTKEEIIDNYIKEDASKGLIYITEIKDEITEIRMDWKEAKEFLQEFTTLENGKLRIYKSDRKVYDWTMKKLGSRK